MSQDVTDCPRCRRRTPAARGQCIYCSETLPFSRIESAPPQRNIDPSEHAFNTVLEPFSTRVHETVVTSLAAALKFDLTEAQALIDVGKRVPVARSQTRAEADMIVALIRTCGLRASVIPDEDLELEREFLRARRIAIKDDAFQLAWSGGAVAVPKSDIKLVVLGDLRNTRVDYTEGISGSGGQSADVLDTSEYRSDESLLDVYTGRIEDSFRIKADAFDYSGLVAPLSFRSDVNFQGAVKVLRAALPHVLFDEDFRKMRSLLERAWPARTHNESRGIKRSGLAFRAVAHSSVISSNRDQFERYSRLMFLSSRD